MAAGAADPARERHLAVRGQWASLIIETGGGLYWTIAGIVFATAGAVANAWVLLIEILR
jgi:hypothetical protein